MRRVTMLMVLLLTAISSGANDFSDAAGAWLLNDNFLDAVSNQDLTNSGLSFLSTSPPEGTHYVDADGDPEYAYLADASLDSTFPGKNGTSNVNLTVCFWANPDVVSTQTVISKYDGGNNKRSWAVQVYDPGTPESWSGLCGHTSGTASNRLTHATDIGGGTWYHVAYVVDSTNNAQRLRVHTTSGVLGSDATASATEDMTCADAAFMLVRMTDAGTFFTGQMDEVVVWNRALTVDEIDAVYAGTYSPPAGDDEPIEEWWNQRRHGD